MMLLGAATMIVWVFALLCSVRVFRRGGWLARSRWLLAAIGCAVVAVLCSSLLMLLQAFHAFTGETLVATVTTQRTAPQEFVLTYHPAEWAQEVPGQTVSLRGDQWAISGGLVKWHPWLTSLGLASYHKPIRISGQFSDLDQQRAQPPTVQALTPGTDWFWEALYRAAPSLPFVEAVYGSAAFVYVEPDVVQEIYVTPTGYLIKRKR
ncbi:MAG: hypothetical protein Q8R78_02115 [Candidatus Omnitrophota bacterium]|nr:hypothetical protein [Candidatus Omnitrophota bacterium]